MFHHITHAFGRKILRGGLVATYAHSSRTQWSRNASNGHKLARWGAAAAFLTAALGITHRTIHLDSEVLSTMETQVFIDPETDISFPTTLRVPSKAKIPELTFLGAGVRRVSILKVKVYSVGIYADLSNSNIKLTPDMTPEEKICHIVQNTAVVIRIVPTRTTSYSHLRDAFVRNLQQRAVSGKQTGTLSPAEEQDVQSAIRKLKSLFPTTSLEKHTPFDIFIPEPASGRLRSLIFRDLGAVENDWTTNEFVLSYVDARALSPALKKEILNRAQRL